MAGPLQRYRELVAAGALQADPAQLRAAEALQAVYTAVLADRPGLRERLFRRHRPGPQGLYLHGAVGRGKTLLMDLFAQALADTGVAVRRVHFHRCMDEIQRALKAHAGQRDPLCRIADGMLGRSRILCFDEFHVSDIGDAMILGELLSHLMARGATLVATSNTAPDLLYADGLQRARFLPAIASIKAHCRVLELSAAQDFRLRELTRHPIWYTPADAVTRDRLAAEFRALATGERVSKQPLHLRGHRITPLLRAGSVVWFDFETLCAGPRASADYIELARRFSTLIVSDVPRLDDAHNDPARRFIHLVDECYDRGVKLIVSAAAPPPQLYTGRRLAAAYERAASRLIEMQSHAYLARPHRP